MDPAVSTFDALERSRRLLDLTGALNLEDCSDKSSLALVALCMDFAELQRHVRDQKRIACLYGLDHPLFDDSSLFRKMGVLACQLVLHADAAEAYCALKSQLLLEESDFFEEVFSKVDGRLKTCKTDDEAERLLQLVFRLRTVYDICL